MTPRALITRALKKAGVNGVGQTPNSADLDDAIADLNDMLAQWQRRRWLVTDLVEVVFGPVGKTSYSIGPAVTSDIIMARPDRIESAFVRFNPRTANPIDYALDVLPSREDYNEIKLKGWQSQPSAIYYDPAYPSGNLFVWPVPQASGLTEIHLFFKNQQFLSLGLDDNINLPPEYGEPLVYNLSARLRFSYQLPLDSQLVGLAVSSLATVRNANAQVPRAKMPPGLPGVRHAGVSGLAGIYGGAIGGSGSPSAFTLDVSPLDGSAVLA